MDISVIVSQFMWYHKTQQKGLQPWVDDIDFVLDEKHRLKVFVCVQNPEIFSPRYPTRKTRHLVYSKMRIFSDAISPEMYISIATDHPNLVIIHGLPHFTTLVAVIIYALKKVPMTLIVHGIYAREGLVNRLRNFALRLVVGKYVDKIFAVTSYDRNLLNSEWGFNDSRIAVVPLGLSNEVKREIEVEKQKTRSKNSRFTYLFVGRLEKEKRAGLLIDAFNDMLTVAKETLPVRLIIVGNGPLYSSLFSKVHKYKLENYINLVGWISRDEIWKYYLEADVIVVSSELEGFPYVIHEAFTCGKPVIASNVCGIPEIVKHEVNGLLFNNREELALCLSRVLNNPRLLTSLGKNAVETIKKYDIRATVQKMSEATGLDLV